MSADMQEVVVHEMYGADNLSNYLRGEVVYNASGAMRRPTEGYVLVGVYQEKHLHKYSDREEYSYLYLVAWAKRPA